MDKEWDEFCRRMKKSDRIAGVFMLIIISLIGLMFIFMVISTLFGRLLILVPIFGMLAVACLIAFAMWAIIDGMILDW